MLFYFALICGAFFCTFWVAQLIFTARHLKWTNTPVSSGEEDRDVGVSIIHPIKDLDFELEKNLESWQKQVYEGPIQHIFSFQEPNDPAIKVVRDFWAGFPEADVTIIVNPVLKGLSGKCSNLVYGVKQARYEILLFGDSDIRIRPDFIVKMVRPLKDEKVGVTTCGQMNRGGRRFWTRFFTFMQNCETDFTWAFLTKLGMDVGTTGAAFAMKKSLLQKIGGFEAFGGSLLEDMHLGNTLYRMGYKIYLGPYLECHVGELEKEKSFNYAKRLGIGIKTHISFELPAFVLMLFWYWLFFFLSLALRDAALLYLTLGFMAARTLQGLIQRPITGNRIAPVDLVIPVFYDLYGTFFLLFSSSRPFITWRGIKYEIKKGGFIEGAMKEETIEANEENSSI